MKTLTGVDLVRLGRELPAVFDLVVTTAAGAINLRCDELLRVTPRCIVARARLDGRDVIAKLYIGARAWVDKEWEERGHAAFVRSGVATTQIIDGGSVQGGGEVLLSEFVDAAPPATDADLMATMPILAQLHAHGVVQNDLHVGNVLRSARGLVLVDGSAVSGMGADAPLSRRASVRNLALYLSQFGIRNEPKFVAAWHAYAVARAFKTIDADAGALIAAVGRARRARARARLRSVMRDNDEFFAERRFGGRLVCDRGLIRGGIASLIEDIDAQYERVAVIKSGVVAPSARMYLGDETLVIERFAADRRGSLARAWEGAIRRTASRRARRVWCNAHRLRLLGVATFHPIALIERRFGPSYLLMRDMGGIDLRERFTNGHIRPLVALFVDLLRAGLVHGDTDAVNFVDVDGVIHVVGLDAMYAPQTRWGASRGQKRDLERFIANWSESATIRAALSRAFAVLRQAGAASQRRLGR